MKKRSDRDVVERRLLYGVNPVLEALRADRVPSDITIAEGVRDQRLRELIELAPWRIRGSSSCLGVQGAFFRFSLPFMSSHS